ncbi:MAG: hypothetical protein NE328_17045 [Lentisphaeraceae bacterium]|nr:hypothetical protein [Lentisphaeraceae bacterium]
MKLLKWISISIAALFATGCAVDIRPHHRHVRVEYDTWDCPPPSHGYYFEGFYSDHGHYGHRGHGHHGRRRHCR